MGRLSGDSHFLNVMVVIIINYNYSSAVEKCKPYVENSGVVAFSFTSLVAMLWGHVIISAVTDVRPKAWRP